MAAVVVIVTETTAAVDVLQTAQILRLYINIFCFNSFSQVDHLEVEMCIMMKKAM